MATPASEPVGSPPPGDDLFDYALIWDYARLLATSPTRHKKLFGGVFLAVLTMTLSALFTLPRSYTAECRILARGSNQHWYLPGDDAPTRAARELILSQANLEALIRETDLMGLADRARTRRIREFLFGWISRPTEEDKREALVETLEKRIRVSVSGEGVIAITASWQEPMTAYHLVEVAQRNFLAGKEASESAAILETIAILDTHLSATRNEVDQQLTHLRATLAKAVPAPIAAKATPRAAPAPAPQLLTEQRTIALAEKRRQLKEREDARNRSLEDIRAELARLRTLYTDNHPLVLAALQRLQQREAEDRDLTALRDQVAALEKEAGVGGAVHDVTSIRPSSNPMSLPREATLPNTTGDPEIDYQSAQLRLLITKYNNLLDRLDSAHIDLETTRAAFKERFKVLRPPQMPRRPDNLQPPLIIAAGVVLGLVLALLTAGLVEMWGGLIVFRWQVERQLGLPLLAEVAGTQP